MNEILKPHQISSRILDLILEERIEEVFLVTPYYNPWKRLVDALEEAAKMDRRIVFVFRSDQEKKLKNDIRLLNDRFGFDIIFVDHLHSKIYANKSSIILSSMNLYDCSQTNNHEFGYYIETRYEVKKIIDNVIKKDFIDSDKWKKIEGRYYQKVKQDEEDRVAKEKKKEFDRKNKSNKVNISTNRNINNYNFGKIGHCLRCNQQIPYNTERPLCYGCYDIWSVFQNYDYEEKYCILCGDNAPTSMRKPLCDRCFNEYPWARPKLGSAF
ncbi:hypothetical protein KQI52_14010 [bacterium]|nr:hypothetical protein [bacterium]